MGILTDKNFIEKYDGILSLKAPLIDFSSELSITDYDQNDYYSDGYTFFRSPLNELNILEKNNFIDLFDEDLFILSIQSDYGSSFAGNLPQKVKNVPDELFLRLRRGSLFRSSIYQSINFSLPDHEIITTNHFSYYQIIKFSLLESSLAGLGAPLGNNAFSALWRSRRKSIPE